MKSDGKFVANSVGTSTGDAILSVTQPAPPPGREIPIAHEVEVRGDRALALEAGAAETELLLLRGAPIGEPVVQYDPFVMNTRNEIQQAFADYQRTQFGGWLWPSHEPVQGRAEGRFARRPDGRMERRD